MRIVFQCAFAGGSQREVVNALRHMVLRSGLDFAPAKVNTRWPRLAYGPALAKGQTALREYADIYLQTLVPVKQVKDSLHNGLPQGLTLLDVYRVPYALACVQQLATVVVYEVVGDFAAYRPIKPLKEYISSAKLEMVKQAANGMKFTTDLKPFVVEAIQTAPARIRLTMRSVADKWMNPLFLVYSWLGIEIPLEQDDLADESFTVIRQGLYWEDSQKNLHLI